MAGLGPQSSKLIPLLEDDSPTLVVPLPGYALVPAGQGRVALPEIAPCSTP